MSEQSDEKMRAGHGAGAAGGSDAAGSSDTAGTGRVDSGAKPLPERLPRPTAWPAALALGVTLLAFGVVTSWIMSVVGLLLFLVAAGGWFMELRYDVLQ